MKLSRPDLYFLIVVLIALIMMAGMTWVNYQFALNNPGGGALLPGWAGAKAWLELDISPYNPLAARTAHEIAYGGPAPSWKDQYLFVSPFYAVLVFGPFTGIEDFVLARAYWMTALEVSLVALTVFSLVITRWNPPKVLLGAFILFVLGGYPSLIPVVDGNVGVLVALLVVLGLFFVQNKQDGLAGIVLALATIKPQMVFLLILFVLLWAYSMRRLSILAGFGGAMLILVLWSNANQSGWILENLTQIAAFEVYGGPLWAGELFELWWGESGRLMGLYFTITLGLLLLREWILAWGKDVRWFLWVAGFTLVTTNLIGLQPATANYSVMTPVLAMIFSIWQQRWKQSGQWLVWVSLVGLGGGLWGLHYWLDSPYRVEHISLYLVFPLFLLVMMYWVRYWAIGSQQLPIQHLEAFRRL